MPWRIEAEMMGKVGERRKGAKGMQEEDSRGVPGHIGGRVGDWEALHNQPEIERLEQKEPDSQSG